MWLEIAAPHCWPVGEIACAPQLTRFPHVASAGAGALRAGAEPCAHPQGVRHAETQALKWLWACLKQISAMSLEREELLIKLGAARAKARAA